ncbi:MAG: glycosyltransferase [Puniceicoccales bacterium]
MRAVLTSHGSTGDIYPMIALGRALLEAGHEVVFATAPLYRAAIERAGLEYRHLPPDWEKEIFIEFMRELNRAPLPLLQLRWIYKGALPFMGELIDAMDEALKGADLLVSSYFFPQYRKLAERHGIPFATFAFCHNLVPTSDYPPEGTPALYNFPRRLQQRWNRFLWRISNQVVDFTVNRTVGELYQQKGLGRSEGFLLTPAELCMVAVSRELMGGIEHDPRFKFTGFLRWQSEEAPEVQAELEAFCAGDKVPIMTFGSVAFDDTHTIMSRFLKNWPRGKKIILQSGWAGLSVELERPEIKVVHQMSHDQLFRFASMVIHHGGAGTTASVLHAGVPNIIIPHIADQQWWASEVVRLKAGLCLGKRKWPEKLPSYVRKIEKHAEYAERAHEVADTLARENGPTYSVRLLEDFVRTRAERAAHGSRT